MKVTQKTFKTAIKFFSFITTFILLFSNVFPVVVFAINESFNPSIGYNDGSIGTENWMDTSNIYTSYDNYAQVGLKKGDTSNYLNYDTGSDSDDTTPPDVPSLVFPANGEAIKPSQAILDWTDVTDSNGPVTYNYQSFWGTSGHYGPVSTGTNSYINATGSPDNTYRWQVQACDALGNCSAWSGPWVVTIDGTPPTDPTNFTSTPATNTLTNDNTVEISWTAGTDNLSGVDGYSYSFTNNPSDTPDDNKDIEENVISITSTPLTSGNWWLHIRTVDNAGNWTSTAHYGPFVIDVDAPDVNITNPSNDWVVRGTINITGTVDDNMDLLRYWFVIQNESGQKVAGPGTVYTPVGTTHVDINYNWNTTSQRDGRYTIKLEARDRADNKDSGSVHWVTVHVDNTPPYTTITSPTINSYWNSAIPISGVSTDLNGIYIVTLEYAEYDIESDTCSSFTHITNLLNPLGNSPFNWPEEEISWTPPADGMYCIKAYAQDNAGNIESSAIVKGIIYDTGDPIVDKFRVRPTYKTGITKYTNGTPYLWAHGYDTLSGIESCYFEYFTDTTLDSISIPGTYDLSSGICTGNIQTALLNNNVYGFIAYFVDKAGNTGRVNSPVYRKVDSLPPTVPSNLRYSDSIKCGDFTNKNNITMIWDESTDGESGFMRYQIQIQLHNGEKWETIEKSWADSNSYDFEFPQEGRYRYRVRSQDNVKNLSDWSYWCKINYDNTNPIIDSINDILVNEGDRLNLGFLNNKGMYDDTRLDKAFLTLTYTDLQGNTYTYINNQEFDVSKINNTGQGGTLNELYEYYMGNPIDFADYDLPVDTGWFFDHTITIFNEGTYTFNYYVTDKAGNHSICNYQNNGIPTNLLNSMPQPEPQNCEFSITINNVIPKVNLTPLNQSISEGETAYFEGSFSDPSYISDDFEVPQEFYLQNSVTEHYENDPDDAPWKVEIDFDYDGVNFTPTVSAYMEKPGDISSVLGTISHKYTHNGVYKVRLEVTEAYTELGTLNGGLNILGKYNLLPAIGVGFGFGGEGEKGYAEVLVTVGDLVPTVSISANPSTNVNVGTPVTLTANVLGGNYPYSYNWQGACSGNSSQAQVPDTIGNHTCIILVTDNDGDTATASITVTVNPLPSVLGARKTAGNQLGQINGDSVTDEAQEEEEVTEGEILGEEICENKSKVSGFVYFDKNNNGMKDEKEKGAEGVLVIIFTENEGKEKIISTQRTDKNGYWEEELCPGDYKVRLEELPSRTKVKNDSVREFKVSENETIENINFEIESLSRFSISWTLCIGVLLILALLAIVGNYFRKKLNTNKVKTF